MANPRQAEKNVSQAGQEATRKVVEETSRAARTAAEAGAGAARAGSDMIQRNAETVQHALETGGKMAGSLTEQTIERLTHVFAFGLTGESAQQATEQSSRNVEVILQSGTALCNGMQNISRECLDFARKRMEQNMERVNALVNCRTPHELLAAQSDLVRNNMEDFVQSTRRIAEISMQMADEAVRRMSDTSPAAR